MFPVRTEDEMKEAKSSVLRTHERHQTPVLVLVRSKCLDMLM